jgi:hypothetical protein
MEVALRSSRTPTIVPSRMSRTIGSSASARTFHRVSIALHLAPDPAHRVLADRAGEQGTDRAAHTARVGAGKISAGDQRIG